MFEIWYRLEEGGDPALLITLNVSHSEAERLCRELVNEELVVEAWVET